MVAVVFCGDGKKKKRIFVAQNVGIILYNIMSNVKTSLRLRETIDFLL